MTLVRCRTAAAAVLAALATTLAAAPALAAPSWQRGAGQGSLEASVAGGSGTDLIVACSAGQEPPLAVLFFVSQAPLAGEVGQHYPVEFRIDGQTMTLVMAQTQATVLEYPAAEKVTFRALEALARLLREGKALSVAAPHLKWEEDYSLKGSGKALDRIFAGCEPAA